MSPRVLPECRIGMEVRLQEVDKLVSTEKKTAASSGWNCDTLNRFRVGFWGKYSSVENNDRTGDLTKAIRRSSGAFKSMKCFVLS